MGGKFANILETIGHTPVVQVDRLAPSGIELFVKIEVFNPLGSVTDRLALGVIEAARALSLQAAVRGYSGGDDGKGNRYREFNARIPDRPADDS